MADGGQEFTDLYLTVSPHSLSIVKLSKRDVLTHLSLVLRLFFFESRFAVRSAKLHAEPFVQPPAILFVHGDWSRRSDSRSGRVSELLSSHWTLIIAYLYSDCLGVLNEQLAHSRSAGVCFSETRWRAFQVSNLTWLIWSY